MVFNHNQPKPLSDRFTSLLQLRSEIHVLASFSHLVPSQESWTGLAALGFDVCFFKPYENYI